MQAESTPKLYQARSCSCCKTLSECYNIESKDSQNGALEDYKIILMESFHILVPRL